MALVPDILHSIPCNREIVRWIEVFVAKLRPLVADDSSNSGKLFLKSDGAPYHKGTIGRRITAFVLKSGVRADRPISATDFRKWLVTAMKAKNRAGLSIDEDLLRRLMCHSEQTAHTWYLREDLTQLAAKASKQIIEHTETSPVKKEARATPQESHPVSLPSVKMPQSLTSEELAAVSEVFADHIRHRSSSPLKKRAVALMKDDERLSALVTSERKVKQVVDRVRYLVRAQQPATVPSLPEEDPQDRTARFVKENPKGTSSAASAYSSASGRQTWTDEETTLIENAFAHFDRDPRNTKIRDQTRAGVASPWGVPHESSLSVTQQVDENVKESLQIVLENVDHNWNLVYEDGDLKGVTAREMAHYFFDKDVRMDWERDAKGWLLTNPERGKI
ncbi:hypothetical protein AWC38_SpisGene8210 [Stylophora pistillata]|uniref:Uncharacterized protein n=1 Tax=Stylophora pistillata TaxID=50429 RepID=A0A2B4SDG0_STYPI|nr:hypothetical protein AWC38_SpisGene8210 [Stylophora pistillata]